MGWYVHINVCFSCRDNDGVALIAKRHLEDEMKSQEALWFLEALAQRAGTNPGVKGGLSMWGIVGNYTVGSEFVESLRPFWTDLLKSDTIGGPSRYDHILVFAEPEQSGKATAFEIFLDGDDAELGLKVVEHECPFAWNQG